MVVKVIWLLILITEHKVYSHINNVQAKISKIVELLYFAYSRNQNIYFRGPSPFSPFFFNFTKDFPKLISIIHSINLGYGLKLQVSRWSAILRIEILAGSLFGLISSLNRSKISIRKPKPQKFPACLVYKFTYILTENTFSFLLKVRQEYWLKTVHKWVFKCCRIECMITFTTETVVEYTPIRVFDLIVSIF